MSVRLAEPEQGVALPRPHHPTRQVRWLAGIGAVAIGCAATVLVVMQLRPPEDLADPLSIPLSNYALTSEAGLFDAATVLLIVGVIGLGGALTMDSATSISALAVAGLGGCAVGLVGVVAFPFQTTPSGQLTITAWIHLGAAGLIFIGPPLAALALAGRHRAATGCSRLPQIAGWLAATTPGWLTVALLLLTTASESTSLIGAWQVGGMVERGLTVADIATALVLATWAWRGCPCQTAGQIGAPGTRRSIAAATTDHPSA